MWINPSKKSRHGSDLPPSMVLARVEMHVLARVLPHVLARVLLHVLAPLSTILARASTFITTCASRCKDMTVNIMPIFSLKIIHRLSKKICIEGINVVAVEVERPNPGVVQKTLLVILH